MNENYEVVDPGHWYQKPTGKIMEYDNKYMQYYTTMDDSMSKLRYDLLSKYVDFKSVCDFGYGDGAFLKYCREKNHDCYGHDISNYPLPENVKFVKNIQNVNVDVITFFDSLEHIPIKNLSPFLSGLNTNYVIISLPWFHENMGMEWFRTWKHRKENEHFHHFDVHGLIELLRKSHFLPIHVCNGEDVIRKPVSYLPNILTIIAKKI